MKSESIAFAVAGVVFGLVAGWVIGAQQAQQTPHAAAASAAQPTSAAPASNAPATPVPVLDQAQVQALTSVASREPLNAAPRAQLGNLYFDAERYDEAIKWYAEAVKLAPNDPNVSTDLGVSYYYTNQPDKALEQFARSLQLEPKHTKTLLNVGIVKAFGKQDLDGAVQAWQQVVQIAPDSPEGQAAKRALDSLRSAHPAMGGPAQKPGA
jgi:tetratricopeptide (TPR) repeat protein